MTLQSTGLPEGFHVWEHHDRLTGKSLVTVRHRSGLSIKILPYPGFARKFVAMTVPFGSVHTQFSSGGCRRQVPAGTAHFLEHCVFSRDESGGLSGRLSDLGASANAYTTYDHTLYYFTTVGHFSEAVATWLDSFFQPQLDEVRIAAERPIILAELDQYQDDPDARCTQLLMENLYTAHPVRLDIGGTAESVAAIRTEDLNRAWQAFYRPDQLTLILVGDFDAIPVLEQLAKRMDDGDRQNRWPPVDLVFPQEPIQPQANIAKQAMDVAMPIFTVGIKDPVEWPGPSQSGMMRAIRQRTARLVLDTLLSPVSPLYDLLYRDGLINDSFGYHQADGPAFAFMACGGESGDPERSAARLQEGLIAASRSGLDPLLFQAQKRSAAGDWVRMLDSVEQAGLVQARCSLLGLDLFDYPGIYDKIDPEQAIRLMACLSDPGSYASAIIEHRR